MANTFNLGNGNWAQKTEKLLAYNAENDNYKPLPFDFDRASTATRVNKQGLIETVGIDEPRIDFLNNSKGHLLLEPQSTNLITYSEDFSQWGVVNGAVVTDNFITSPDGTQNAAKIVYNGTSSGRIEIATSASGTNTQSIYLKTASGTQAVSIGASSGSLTELTVTSEWQRFSHTGSGSYPRVLCNDASTIYAWGAQLEAGSYPTSYIPTSGSAVTRSAETAIDSGNTNVINSTEGVLYAEIEGFISTDIIEPNRYITITNNTSNERVALLLGGNTNQLRAIVYSNTQSINLSFTTSLTDVKQFNKLAVKYKSGDYAFFLNGTKIGSSTETNIFTANTLNDISFDVGGGTQQFRGKTKDVRVYNTALTDAELIALTS